MVRSSPTCFAAIAMPPCRRMPQLYIEAEDGPHMLFVVTKTRVAPLNKQSVPRLELLSAVLLARLMDATKSSLTSELEISYHCFTDS